MSQPKMKNINIFSHKMEISQEFSTWLTFILFSLLLFVKNVLFHYDAFHALLISSLWRDPFHFYTFYMAKLLMPLFIANFILISRHKWWTILVSFLVDLWCIANLIYYKTYDDFLKVSDILLAGNMGEAWNSVWVYFDWIMVLMLLLSFVWMIFYLSLARVTNRRYWITHVVLLVVVYLLGILNNFLVLDVRFWGNESDMAKEARKTAAIDDFASYSDTMGSVDDLDYDFLNYLPYYFFYYRAKDIAVADLEPLKGYICRQSIISDFFAINIYHLFKTNKTGENIELHDEDIADIEKNLHPDTCVSIPQNHLLVILVESMESWPLEHDIEGQNIAPNLRNMIEMDHVLYCDKITCETMGGNSGDGQMIANTGLLPTRNEIACMHYGNSVYPNFAHFFSSSYLINPWPKVWNQDTMSVRYAYNETIDLANSWDGLVLDTAYRILEKATEPTCVMAITVSTHTPFNRVENSSISTSAPGILNRYMQCYHYMDSCVGIVMQKIVADPVLSQSTVVFASDHTIFKPAMLNEFQEYSAANNLSIASGQNYCPLIIYSPQIEGNLQINEICYQMDVYPTILHLLNGGGYFWHGLGVNLLDDAARRNRMISEQEAYRISNLIIRGNYFGLKK